MIKYELPQNWIWYDHLALINELVEAKAAVKSLTTIPFQRGWAQALQELQLKREVAGTSKIEGADFTEKELDAALAVAPGELITRSQKQARAAVETYRWIARLQDDRPITAELIRDVHRRIVTGADDDHCTPGDIRARDQNVIFGSPAHRGAEGGPECERAFSGLAEAVQHEYKGHDLLIQALALHYHFAAIHPFLDGNGRTARALEALTLQRAGLKDVLFIAMSNYYYDEKTEYLATLGKVRASGHDLTSFLRFGLRGIAVQCTRLFSEIRTNIAKEIYLNLMDDLFNRLWSPRKRIIARRQSEILKLLLKEDEMEYRELVKATVGVGMYDALGNPGKAFARDLNYLLELGAVHVIEGQEPLRIRINLEWPAEITESRFFEITRDFPKAKPHSLTF
jgi:Fic family protein